MGTYDRLDVAGLTAQAVEQLGDVTRVVRDGRVETRTGLLTPRDADGNPIGELTEYEKAEDEIVGGILDTSDNAATSTLVDYSNLSYESHHLDSPDDIQAAVDDPKLVVMMPSPRNKDRFIGAVEDDVTDADFEAYLDQRNVSPEQKAALIANRKAQKDKAFDLVRNRIRTGLKVTETAQEIPTTKAPSAEVMKMQEALAEESSLLGDWMQLLYATDEERIDALEDAIAGDPSAQERGIRNIEASGDSVVITYTDERAKKEGKSEVTIPKARLGDTENERAVSMRNWAVAGRGIHGVSTDRSDRILVDRGFITIEEGEDGTPVVVQQGEAVMDPEVSGGGPIDPIADFNTDTMGVTYTSKSGTSAGKTEVIQVPYSKVFDDEVTGQKKIDLDTASSVLRKIIEQAGRGRLDSRFITPISKDAVGEKAPELGTSEGFVWGQVGVISFYVPEAMDDVIYIPAHQNAKAKLRDLTERVLSYAKRGEKMSMEEIQNWIDSYGDDDLSDYNVSLPTVFGIGTPEQVPSRTERSVGPVPRLVPPLETDSVPRVNG